MSDTQRYRLPQWQLPPGVAPGTWEYTQRESIAVDYQDFLKSTPLIEFDLRIVHQHLPAPLPGRTSRVLDLGCGDGRALLSLWNRGYDVLGIDMSQPMLECILQRPCGDALKSRRVRANLVQLDAFSDQVADHAICLFSTIGMIRGREHRRRFLSHVHRMVKPGGHFVLHVHNRNDAWRDRPSTAAYLRSLWQSVKDSNWEIGDRVYAYRGLADMFLHTYSLAELKRDLNVAGWQIKTIVSLNRTSDNLLSHPKLLPSLRAGGYIAIACREP